jgi:spermidine/putrescine ABC transporter ATP-binding subunit
MRSAGVAEPALSLIGLEKRYGEMRAVAGISLDVLEGEFLTLLGPSGCGKTTTLGLIAGFFPPSAGEVRIQGRSVTNLPPFRRDIGVVFQDYALFPHMTAAQNVAFGLRMRKVAKAETERRVDEALALVQLGGLGDRRPQELSGGQRQRVALARALVIRPAILLLDEPLSNLDLKLREEMRVEIADLQRRLKITTVFVTHDQGEALVMSDRIAVMNAGTIEQVGLPADIYERPVSRFVAEFIGRMNFFSGRIGSEAGRLVVSTAHRSLALPIPPGAGEGIAVNIAIRPERAHVALEPPTSDCFAARGRVRQILYLGSTREVRLELEGGARAVVEAPNVGANVGPGPGDAVWFTAPLEACLVLPSGTRS